MKQILVVLTSCLPPAVAAGRPTGRWLRELIQPYRLFREAGYALFAAAPHAAAECGKWLLEAMKEHASDVFRHSFDPALDRLLMLEEMAHRQFDAIFLAGPHAANLPVGASCFLGRLFDAGGVIGAVSYGPSALLQCVRGDGQPLVFRRSVTGLSNAEEDDAAGDAKNRFRLEDRLRAVGAHYLCGVPWEPHVVVDGNLVTGQNPGSAAQVAEEMIRRLENG